MRSPEWRKRKWVNRFAPLCNTPSAGTHQSSPSPTHYYHAKSNRQRISLEFDTPLKQAGVSISSVFSAILGEFVYSVDSLPGEFWGL